MAKPTIAVSLRIDPPFDELAIDIQGAIIEGGVKGVNAGLDILEGTQVGSYTSSGRPAQPSGSTYNRTFTLQKSSKKKRARVSNLKIKGVWLSDGSIAPYNVFVIGKRQARIHTGRWLTDVQLAKDAADDITDEIINNLEIELRAL